MIQDWTKYEAYRSKLVNSIKHQFSTIDDDTFYDLFQEAYLEKFPEFECKFDATKSQNELGYLYKFVINKINDLLNKQQVQYTLNEKIKDDDDYEDVENDENSSAVSFADFLYRIVTRRSEIDAENIKIAKKHYEMVTPLIKMEAWAQKASLTEEILIRLSDKVMPDFESGDYYDWTEPTSIVRLISWVGCF